MHNHINKQQLLIFNYPDSYWKYMLETEYRSALYAHFSEQVCILQNPRSCAGISFIYDHKESTNLDGWIKFRIIKSYHGLCIRKTETNIKLHQLFLGKKD